MLGLIFRLSALAFGVSYATLPSTHLPPSQALASLNERMNEMINALYASSPVLAKLKAASTPATKPAEPTETAPSETTSPKAENEQYYQVSAPVAASQTYLPSPQPAQKTLEAGIQPAEYIYPSTTHPVPRSILSPLQFPIPTTYPAPYPCEYHHQYPEYPVFPTPFLPSSFPAASSVYATSPCLCSATASLPPTAPSFSPSTPSYAAPPPYSPATPSYSPSSPSLASYYQNLPQPYQTVSSNYSPTSVQGEANASPQYS